MDLNNEVREFKKSFRDGGILTRTLLILGFILTLSSITSLSSIVIEWKGFILDGLNFYQSYFVQPIISASSVFGLEYSKAEIHAATISSICVSVGMRLLAIGQIAAFREISTRYNKEVKPNLTIFLVFAIAFPIGVWAWYGLSNPTIRPWAVILVSVFYPVFIVAPKFIMSKFGYEHYEKNQFSYFKSYYAYMATIFIIIGALAAINLGLQEAEPNKSLKAFALLTGTVQTGAASQYIAGLSRPLALR